MVRKKGSSIAARPVRTKASIVKKSRFTSCKIRVVGKGIDHESCPTSYQRFYFSPNSPKPVYLDEFIDCDCTCHKKENK